MGKKADVFSVRCRGKAEKKGMAPRCKGGMRSSSVYSALAGVFLRLPGEIQGSTAAHISHPSALTCPHCLLCRSPLNLGVEHDSPRNVFLETRGPVTLRTTKVIDSDSDAVESCLPSTATRKL